MNLFRESWKDLVFFVNQIKDWFATQKADREYRAEQRAIDKLFNEDAWGCITREEFVICMKQLLEMAENGKGPPLDWVGICSNISELLREHKGEYHSATSICCQLFKGWEHHSGVHAYPIPNNGGPLWKGRQLRARCHLMRYVLAKLEKQR